MQDRWWIRPAAKSGATARITAAILNMRRDSANTALRHNQSRNARPRMIGDEVASQSAQSPPGRLVSYPLLDCVTNQLRGVVHT